MNIGIAGSMQYTERMIEVYEQLIKLGHKPFMSKFAEHYLGKSSTEIETIKLDDKYNHDAIREFWRPMQKADALLVLNYDKDGIANYIGGNTFLEMGFAHVLNQPIYLMNPVPAMPYYETEIIAMKPTIINGDLRLIH